MEDIKEIEKKLCEIWNKHRTVNMPKAVPSKKNQKLRLKRLGVRWEEYPDFEVWEKVFAFMAKHAWYSGENPGGWVSSFTWVCQPGKFEGLVERSSGMTISDEDAVEDAIDKALRGLNEAV